MKIYCNNNINFKSLYYRGNITSKKGNYSFDIKSVSPWRYISQEQNSVTEIIEDAILKNSYYSNLTGQKENLENILTHLNTNIIIYYNKDTIKLYLQKYGIGSHGELYNYIPYNKEGSEKIETEFSTDSISKISICPKLYKFMTDCKLYMNDKFNKKNNELENIMKENY